MPKALQNKNKSYILRGRQILCPIGCYWPSVCSKHTEYLESSTENNFLLLFILQTLFRTMNQLPIKASQINNLTDARYFAARGVDWLTFNLETSNESYLSTAEIHAICDWVEGPKIVGNFGLQDAKEILALSEELNLDAIQLHPYMPLHQLDVLSEKTIIQTFVVEHLDDIKQQLIPFVKDRAASVNYFLIDFSSNQISWSQLQTNPELLDSLNRLCQQHHFFFQLSFEDNNPLSFIEMVHPYGLDIRGSEEEKVGFKSFDELDELLDHLEILD